MKSASKNLHLSYQILRYTYGILFILVGADKFFNLMTDWHQFISPQMGGILPISQGLVLKLFGVSQIIAGLLLFTRWIAWGILLIFILLSLIFINLLSSQGGLVVIIHDLYMIVGVVVLWQLRKNII